MRKWLMLLVLLTSITSATARADRTSDCEKVVEKQEQAIQAQQEYIHGLESTLNLALAQNREYAKRIEQFESPLRNPVVWGVAGVAVGVVVGVIVTGLASK